MSPVQTALGYLVATAGLAGAALPVSATGMPVAALPALAAFAALAVASLARFRLAVPVWADGLLSLLGAAALIAALPEVERAGPGFWLLLVAAWAAAFVRSLASVAGQIVAHAYTANDFAGHQCA